MVRHPRTPRVVVLFLHGIGADSPRYANAALGALLQRLRNDDVPSDAVVPCSVRWNEPLDWPQASYLIRTRVDHWLDWWNLRDWIVDVLGDAAAYQRTAAGGSADGLRSAYEQAHAAIDAALSRIARQDPSLADAPLVVAAHSLGTVVLSNHAWDRLHPAASRRPAAWARRPPATPLERFETLAGIVTFGSPLPLFLLGLPEIVPIPFPSEVVRERYGSATRWVNLFDRDDPLAWPLGPLGAGFAEMVEDREVRLRGPAGMLPLSHLHYWSDPAVADAVAEQVGALLEVDGQPRRATAV